MRCRSVRSNKCGPSILPCPLAIALQRTHACTLATARMVHANSIYPKLESDLIQNNPNHENRQWQRSTTCNKVQHLLGADTKRVSMVTVQSEYMGKHNHPLP
jgi:hypothetical protein